MFDKINDLNPQVRMLLAVIVCIIFFVPYSYFFAPEPRVQDNNHTATATQDAPQAPLMQSSAPVPTLKQIEASEILLEIKADRYRLLIDTKGRIAQVYLLDKRYQSDGKEIGILDTKEHVRPLEVRYSNKDYMQQANLNQNSYKIISQHSKEVLITDTPQTIILQQTLDPNQNISIQKELTFYPDGHYDVKINGMQNDQITSLNSTLFITPGARPIAENDSFVFKGGIIKENDGTISTFEDGDVTEESTIEQAKFLANVDRYYATVLYLPQSGQHNDQYFKAAITQDQNNDALLFATFENQASFSGYIGPKELKHLKDIDPLLSDVVEYGLITFFAKPLFSLLEWLYGLCGNWGWAIVLLTVIVRFVLFPLTYKGMMSMQKFKDIAPKMKEIQQKYKDDPQKMQTHMMELYRKHGANPLGGCLPLLLQMPIFFAIYRVLYNAIELKGAEWIGWISDLSVMDPYFVLPVLMGLSMFVQQHITPTSFTDPMQEKVFKYLPVIFTIFFVTFPSGLVLYWFVSNIFSIAQQYVINKIVDSRKQLAQSALKEKEKADEKD